MSTSLLRTAFLTATALALGISVIPQTHAQTGGIGTVIVDQGDTEFLGSWGLATPVGVISGTTRLFTSTEKPAGNYSLTVTPPAGALVKIDVYNNDTLTKSDDSRTAAGILGSGGTLKFKMSYDFVLMGTVSVLSSPSGLQATLKGPRGAQTVTTPFTSDTMPEGSYSVTYILPKSCRPIPPLARNLETKGRITFVHESKCEALIGGASSQSSSVSSSSSSSSSVSSQPAPSRPVNPLRVSLTSAAGEITAGATARMTVAVFNRGDSVLRNLTVDYRFDGAKLSVQGARGATMSPNQASWTIPSLAAGAKWEESFAVKADPALQNGTTLTSSVTVLGNDVSEVPASQRSASNQLSVIKMLPKTGVPLDLLYLLVGAVSSGAVTIAGGVAGYRKRL